MNCADTREEISCNPTPVAKNATLPEGCVVHGTTNNIVDVGQCLPEPCLRNDSALSNTACHDATFCCVTEEVEDVAISCGGAVTFNISKISRCGCQECEKPKSYITGVVVGIKGAVENPIMYCEIKIGDDYYNADEKGAFEFEVPEDKQRLTAVFMDTFGEEYADFTKVFRIVQGQSLFYKIVLRVKPALTPFNSSEPFKVPMGDSGDGSAFAEIEIPEDALLKEDGTIYSGQANFRMSVTDPRNATDVMTAPADFSTIDEDGEEQILVSYGMLSLDFEDENGNKLSTSKSIKLFLDPEKLNISVDSNGNTSTKLWWLDENMGRWMEAGDLWLDTKKTNRSRRSPTRFLLTEITPVVQRQGKLNVDVKANFGAVRVEAPTDSKVRILCKEPNTSGNQYAGYLEESVDASGVKCISVWIDRECFMQGESNDARYLDPVDRTNSFPSSMLATVIETNLGGNPKVRSFSFTTSPDSNGPVYSHNDKDLQKCRASDEQHSAFKFNSPESDTFNLISQRPKNIKLRDPLNWYPEEKNCFIKILTTGKRSIFLASSYRANQTNNVNRFGSSVATAEAVTGASGNTSVACLDIRCPGKVYDKDKSVRNDGMVEEWTYVLVTPLTGSCYLSKNNLLKQDNLDNNGAKCPPRSKHHASGSDWFCIPLPSDGGFTIDKVYTSPRNKRKLGAERCKTGNNLYNSGSVTIKSTSPTIEFTCR